MVQEEVLLIYYIKGNDEIMARGTFANTRIINKLVTKVGP